MFRRVRFDVLIADEAVKPIGLGARDSLRLEAGLPLYGHDIDRDTTPVMAGLTFAISKRRRAEGGFPGAIRILAEIENGPPQKRVGEHWYLGTADAVFQNLYSIARETPSHVIILHEYLSLSRIIPLDAQHPPDPDPFYMGHSVGRWEGDALIVDSVGFKESEVSGYRTTESTSRLERVIAYTLLIGGSLLFLVPFVIACLMSWPARAAMPVGRAALWCSRPRRGSAVPGRSGGRRRAG